ncbi:MAG: helix-turn-helix transcriptional regulator [Clostridiales bacterium]|nr:helix-turn-helix transcriptional regulator [Clostridiales bacterium]
MIKLDPIRKKIIEAIKQSGMSKSDLATRVGVCHQAIGQYLYQNKMPALDTLANLCAVLDLDANEILCVADYNKED